MSNLTESQLAFIKLMEDSEEAEADGFAALIKRPDAIKFFPALDQAGFFEPEKNKGPEKVGNNRVRIPHWQGLTYLVNVARQATEHSDAAIIERIIQILIATSKNAENDQAKKNNYHTWHEFAEIAATLPPAALTEELIDVVPTWLSSEYDNDLVGAALGNQLIPRLLASAERPHHAFALALLRFATAIRWGQRKQLSRTVDEPRSVVDGYWLKNIIDKNIQSFALKIARPTAELFRERLREIFSKGTHAEASWVARPAIENHDQNHDWHEVENNAVNGLRDLLLLWIEDAPEEALLYTKDLFDNGVEIEQRIAIHVLDVNFDLFQNQLHWDLDDRLLKINLIHETYRLLSNRFSKMNGDQKTRVFEIIINLPPKDDSEDSRRRTERTQVTWLSAIKGKGRSDVDGRYAELVARVGPESDHPDFLSYIQSFSGPGPSAYSSSELIQFCLDGSLVTKLNEFTNTNFFRGPTKRALTETLEGAIKEKPSEFFDRRLEMLGAHRPYQYAYLRAYLDLWKNDPTNSQKSSSFDWTIAWPQLLDLVLSIIEPETFWSEPVEEDEDLTPTRLWIPPVVAELIEAGTRNDEHAFAPELLPKAQRLLELLLTHLPSEAPHPGSDPVTYALNASRGKAIEALLNFALRSARVLDKAQGQHTDLWTQKLEPIFDHEVKLSDGGNWEFVTLFGQYVPQLQFLSDEWVKNNFTRVFDKSSPQKFAMALAGLAFAPASRSLYKLLKETTTLQSAIELVELAESARERLVQRVALAYIWGDETLDGAQLNEFFAFGRVEDLATISEFFWSISGQKLDEEQIERIKNFWRQTTKWAKGLKHPPERLFARLSRIISYLNDPTDEDGELLVWLAGFADFEHGGWFFIKDVSRLVTANPNIVADALVRYVATFHPYYDHEDILLETTKKLAELGLKDKAVQIAEELRSSDKFRELYAKIR